MDVQGEAPQRLLLLVTVHQHGDFHHKNNHLRQTHMRVRHRSESTKEAILLIIKMLFHFTDGEVKAQRGYRRCSRSHGPVMGRPGA